VKPEQIAIICFSEEVIVACRKEFPHLTANWLVGYKQDKETGQWQPGADSVLASLERSGASGLGTQTQPAVINQEFADRLREAGYGFHCWTVDEAEMARQFQALGVDSITTNRPEFIRAALAAEGARQIR
jgi:glycerophosphoryl diester phosphodiesterase